MSTAVSAGVWMCGPQDGGLCFLMCALAENADDFGFCFPSIATLAQKTRVDERTVKRRIKQLELEGWVRIGRKVVNNKGNVYFIDLAKIGVTTSPEARISPLHLKFLKRSQDTLPPISPPEARPSASPPPPFFAAKKSGDTNGFSGDNPQGSQVTERKSQGTPVQGQGTPGAEIGDKLCPPNRKEPSREPSGSEPSGEPSEISNPAPLPPTGGDLAAESLAIFQSRFNQARVALKSDLSPLFRQPRFTPIRPGENDYDACFRDWWLESITQDGVGRYVFVTSALDVAATVQGIEKYELRLTRLIAIAFRLQRVEKISFSVRQHRTEESAA